MSPNGVSAKNEALSPDSDGVEGILRIYLCATNRRRVKEETAFLYQLAPAFSPSLAKFHTPPGNREVRQYQFQFWLDPKSGPRASSRALRIQNQSQRLRSR